jgi:hypothetical protein
MRLGLMLDIAQFAVGGIGILLYFHCETIMQTVFLVCGLSAVLFPLQYFSNKLHGGTDY